MVPILMFVIPSVFFLVVYLTTSERVVPFEVASLIPQRFIEVSERFSSLVFFSVASVGFLSSYIGLVLIQDSIDVNKRLIICGYHPSELLMSNLIVLLLIIVFVAVYTALAILLFFRPEQFVLFCFALVLSGLVYGFYGLLVGSIVKGELEGILFIVLLANIDAGWLQNPLFYSEALNKDLIKYLPAYYPSQMAIVAAFESLSVSKVLIGSVGYSAVFAGLANVIYYLKMRKV
ncbi:hypothetical protein [Carboxylicivirga marina]|uniref:ABC transporter permease n=2 Tax=Carboxylicivirga marina TaxID=2800988 RepID=A0ABS1HEL1_9BACT|nr:hypothetical protein [Carboxylicivirga marina]MBK3516115.1 hypothetical protein [Carboxylicivirga marina]